MKLIITIVIPFLLLSCNQKANPEKAKVEKKLVSDIEIYDVINSVLKPDKEKTSYYFKARYLVEEQTLTNPPKAKDLFGIEKMDTLFSKKDIAFIYAQYNGGAKFKLNQKFLKDYTAIPRDTLSKLSNNKNGSGDFWGNFHKKYDDCFGFSTVSLPLFSIDRKVVIISYGTHCGGLCGSGETVILKKINGKWKLIASLETWVS